MTDLKVYINRRDVAQMHYRKESGVVTVDVPVIVRLVEGGSVKPPMHADVVYPTRAQQLIKTFVDAEKARPTMSEYTPEDYVDFIDKKTNHRRLSINNMGMAMVLPLN